jgi:alpha-L-arabinofuranosidase
MRQRMSLTHPVEIILRCPSMKRILCSLFCVLVANVLVAAPAKISVRVDKPGHPVSPLLWGIFFEDINLSADGGLYPELVRNRSFEDAGRPDNWKLVNLGEGKSYMNVDSSRPLNPFNRHSLRLKLEGDAQLMNEGYWGMNIVRGERYTFKVAARSADGFVGPITVALVGGGKELAQAEIKSVTGAWEYYTVELVATGSETQAALQLGFSGKGAVYLDMISLMPNKRWKSSQLRTDLAEAMAALRPAFLRFPGGCWVEGENLDRMYDWKKTIGNLDVRQPLYNIWQYHATHGLGYHEYLLMAEDLGAEPLFCINVGMSHRENVPLDLMGQWVQDALDAIEYANGPTNSVWGGLRARNGHPAPFNLKYIEIGNENGGIAYNERWPLFVHAIKAKYPEIQLIANHWLGGYPKQPMPEIVDEHYYNTPEWFMKNADRYDGYDRKGPKIFVGEYAVTRNAGLGNLRGAIGEAAFMTGMERNSDIVVMAAYAPLFCNANHKRWPVNLINFDSSRWFGIPSYYVQKLFAENTGTVTLPTTVEVTPEQEPSPTGAIGVGTWNTSAEFKDIKVTGTDGRVLFASDFRTNAQGWKLLGDGANWSVSDGVLRQTAEREFIRAIAGDKSWGDYTIELKARKLGGQEGFLVLFHINDDEDRNWWNLGGWQNTQHAIELGETLDAKRGRIETARWYDIKVQVDGAGVKCWLDGKVVHDLKSAQTSMQNLFASATRDAKTGDIIVKVVNSSAMATETEINLAGVGKLTGPAQVTVLTSANPKDENTLDEPTKVSPKTELLKLNGSHFTRAFPGNSFTVLRIPAAK